MQTIKKLFEHIMSPWEEMVAWETLWAEPGMSEKQMTQIFEKNNHRLPSEVVSELYGNKTPLQQNDVEKFLKSKIGNFAVCTYGNFNYPQKLMDAQYPLELFYYQGNLNLVDEKCLSIVGSRDCTKEGKLRAERLVKLLVEENFVIVSGLAKGIDTIALETAIKVGGKVIGVIGTPIDQYYPNENKDLQDEIAKNHLLISQVPFYRYHLEPFKNRRFYFPKRNITMSALSQGTIIVEASDTSGTLTQARAAIAQKRQLFILNSCFERKDITWPLTYEKKGAHRVRDLSDIINLLEKLA